MRAVVGFRGILGLVALSAVACAVREVFAAYLPSGNALVTYSNMGLIRELDRSSGEVVQSFQSTTFGYVEFRTSLNGPPLD